MLTHLTVFALSSSLVWSVKIGHEFLSMLIVKTILIEQVLSQILLFPPLLGSSRWLVSSEQFDSIVEFQVSFVKLEALGNAQYGSSKLSLRYSTIYYWECSWTVLLWLCFPTVEGCSCQDSRHQPDSCSCCSGLYKAYCLEEQELQLQATLSFPNGLYCPWICSMNPRFRQIPWVCIRPYNPIRKGDRLEKYMDFANQQPSHH